MSRFWTEKRLFRVLIVTGISSFAGLFTGAVVLILEGTNAFGVLIGLLIFGFAPLILSVTSVGSAVFVIELITFRFVPIRSAGWLMFALITGASLTLPFVSASWRNEEAEGMAPIFIVHGLAALASWWWLLPRHIVAAQDA